MRNAFFLIFGFCFIVSVVTRAEPKSKFPPFIHICKRSPEAFNCVLENFERCKPFLAKGIPKLGVPPMSPFNVPSLDILGNNLVIRLKDLKVHNLPTVEILDGSIEFDNFKLILDLRIPHIFNEFQYEANGRILVLNFNGKGSGNVNASDVSIRIDAKGHQFQRNGKTWLTVDDVKVVYASKGGKFYLNNLFNNQAALNEHTNRLINDNFNEFENEISPNIAKSIAELMKGIATNLFQKFSLDELFPLE